MYNLTSSLPKIMCMYVSPPKNILLFIIKKYVAAYDSFYNKVMNFHNDVMKLIQIMYHVCMCYFHTARKRQCLCNLPSVYVLVAV